MDQVALVPLVVVDPPGSECLCDIRIPAPDHGAGAGDDTGLESLRAHRRQYCRRRADQERGAVNRQIAKGH